MRSDLKNKRFAASHFDGVLRVSRFVAGWSYDCRRRRRVQYAGAILPNSEAGQAIRRVCTGVDIDPVRPEVWCQDRRVSVNDDPPVIPEKVEESTANSQYVVPGLIFKLDARTNACMHKQIAVGFTVWRGVQKEPAMLGRQKRRERLSNLSLRCLW